MTRRLAVRGVWREIEATEAAYSVHRPDHRAGRNDEHAGCDKQRAVDEHGHPVDLQSLAGHTVSPSSADFTAVEETSASRLFVSLTVKSQNGATAPDRRASKLRTHSPIAQIIWFLEPAREPGYLRTNFVGSQSAPAVAASAFLPPLQPRRPNVVRLVGTEARASGFEVLVSVPPPCDAEKLHPVLDHGRSAASLRLDATSLPPCITHSEDSHGDQHKCERNSQTNRH